MNNNVLNDSISAYPSNESGMEAKVTSQYAKNKGIGESTINTHSRLIAESIAEYLASTPKSRL